MKNLPKFKNKKLFEQAFTHRSYLNETKETLESNERLEFLGDSILSFIVSQYLFITYPAFNEGTLTNIRSMLVNTKSLAKIAKELDFGTLLKLSRGEEESKGRENETLLANSLEAFIGALFLDTGIEEVKSFLTKVLLIKSQDLVSQKNFKDPKSLLQEQVQAKKAGGRSLGEGGQKSPLYRVLTEEGLPHARQFTVGVFIGTTLAGKGTGRSKQEAEENAAKQALKQILERKSK